MRDIRFVFSGEGTSDDGLLEVIERLLLEVGAASASGLVLRPPTKRVPERLRWMMDQDPGADAWILHRDADASKATGRSKEFRDSIRGLAPELARRVVPVIPIQEMEAWLLLDEQAIRQVVGNRTGRVALELPRRSEVEATARPKERLWEALRRADGGRGRRALSAADLSGFRRILLSNLPVHSGAPVRELPSFQSLVQELDRLVR